MDNDPTHLEKKLLAMHGTPSAALADAVDAFLTFSDSYAEENDTRLVPWKLDCVTIRAMRHALAAYEAKPQPSAVVGHSGEPGFTMVMFKADEVPAGTSVFLEPQPAAGIRAGAGNSPADDMAYQAHRAVQAYLDLVSNNEDYEIEEYRRLSRQHSEAVVFAINNLRDLAAAPAVSAPAQPDARDAARYRVLRAGSFSFGPRITDPTNEWLGYTPEGLDKVCDEMVALAIQGPVTGEQL